MKNNEEDLILRSFEKVVTESILVLDEKGTVLFISEDLISLLDIPFKKSTRIPILQTLGEKHRLYNPIKRALKGEDLSFEFTFGGSTFNLKSSRIYSPEYGSNIIIAAIKNATEEVLAEKAFRYSEKQRTALFYNSSIPMFIYEIDKNNIPLRIKEVNDRFIKILGYKSSELLASRPEMFDETMKNNPSHILEKMIKENRITYETKLMSKTGTYIHAQILAELLITDEKRIVLCNVKDLSITQEMKKLIEETITNYQNLGEIWPDGLLIYQDFKIVFINETGAKILGAYSKNEIIGKSIFEIVPSKYHQIIKERAEQISVKQVKFPPVEMKFENSRGKVVDLEIIQAYHKFKGEKCILAVFRDITEKIIIRREIEDRRQYLENLLKWVPAAVVAKDMDDKITTWNAGAEALFGYSSSEALGKNHYRLITRPDILEESMNFSRIILEKGYLSSTETIRYTKNDKPVNVLLSGARIVHDQKATGIVYIYKDISELKDYKIELIKTHQILRQTLIQISSSLAGALELRDPYTFGHGRSVSQISRAIAECLGWKEERIIGIELAGLLHDIGKLGVPIEILTKPRKLNDNEFQIIKEHSVKGYEILKDIPFPFPIAEAVLQHHERLNGTGYPKGLKSKDIIYEAKILAVSDVLEAMCAHRPYRPAHDIKNVIKELQDGAGHLFDKEIVMITTDLIKRNDFKLFWINAYKSGLSH